MKLQECWKMKVQINELEIAHLIRNNARKIVAEYLGANQDKLPEEIFLSWQNFEDLSKILEVKEKDFLMEVQEKRQARNKRTLSLCRSTIIYLLLLSLLRLFYGAPLSEYLSLPDKQELVEPKLK